MFLLSPLSCPPWPCPSLPIEGSSVTSGSIRAQAVPPVTLSPVAPICSLSREPAQPGSFPPSRTEAAHPRGNCWARGQKTTNLGAEDA